MSSFFSYFSWFEIVLLMVGLMSGILSLFREVVLIGDPEKAKDGHLFWRCVFIAFIISSAWLWISEHHQTLELQTKLNELTKPELVIDEHQSFVRSLNATDAEILVLMRVTDLGAPTVIKHPEIIVVTKGREIHTQWLGVPVGPIGLQQPNGIVATVRPDQYLMTRAGENPIPHNGAAEGFIWARVAGLKGARGGRLSCKTDNLRRNG